MRWGSVTGTRVAGGIDSTRAMPRGREHTLDEARRRVCIGEPAAVARRATFKEKDEDLRCVRSCDEIRAAPRRVSLRIAGGDVEANLRDGPACVPGKPIGDAPHDGGLKTASRGYPDTCPPSTLDTCQPAVFFLIPATR